MRLKVIIISSLRMFTNVFSDNPSHAVFQIDWDVSNLINSIKCKKKMTNKRKFLH